MNSTKTNSYGKLIAFFVIAVALVCALGFAANGWQDGGESSSGGNVDQPTDGTIGDGDSQDGTSDDGAADNGKEPVIPEVPKYINALTGLEVSEEEALRRPIAFVMDSSAPLYGTSDAPLMIELPVEGGRTRLLTFSTDISRLGKIGSLASTRKYITNLAKYFDSVLVSHGNDDTVEYSGCEHGSLSFDLSVNLGYHYTEYTEFLYSNGDLIKAGINNTDISTVISQAHGLPFDFSDEIITLTDPGSLITIPYSDSETVVFSYDEDTSRYIMSRDGAAETDLLTNRAVAFDNVFLLLADSVTYEGEDNSELVMKTVGGGRGYYISNGGRIPITWCATDDGDMLFQTSEGTKLMVNRGSSYIGFIKSSKGSELIFS